MKKHLVSLVAFAALVSLVGCKGNSSSPSGSSSSSPIQDTSSAASSSQGTSSSSSSSSAADVAVTGVTLNKTTAELVVGNNVTLTATVAPANATNKTVTWTSDHADIASVANGVVTANKAGTAVITATAGGKKATCTVTVREMTAAERHANYMTKNSDKTAVITIQGKVVHSVAYPSSVNCNIAIQEGKYGYFMNNVPQSSVEIGKSYIFTGKGAGRDYPALNMTGGTVTPLETPVVADPLIIGSDVSFEDSRNALFNLPEGGVTVTEVVKTGETTTGLKFKIGENDYLISYNTKVISADSIATKLATAGVGTKITNLKAAWFYDNSTDYPYETYQICDAADITLEAATPASVAVTAAK